MFNEIHSDLFSPKGNNMRMRQSPRPYNVIYTVNHVYKYHLELRRWLKNFVGSCDIQVDNLVSQTC